LRFLTERLRAAPSAAGVLYVSGQTYVEGTTMVEGAVLRSVDGGAHWTAQPVPLEAMERLVRLVAVAPDDADDRWLVVQGPAFDRLLRSRDGGASWAEVTRIGASPPPASAVRVGAGARRDDVVRHAGSLGPWVRRALRGPGMVEATVKKTMRRQVAAVLAAWLGAPLASCGSAERTITIGFEGRVADRAFECGTNYDGVGRTGSTLTPLDLRFYVHDVGS
jgi:hypothetical protein